MLSSLHAFINQSLQTTWQIIAAGRYEGYEKNVFRIQGFVAGALLITIIDLAIQLLFAVNSQQSKRLATAWTTAVLAGFVYAWIVAWIDRNEKEPWHMLLVGLLWGAVVSAAIAGLLNSIAPRLIGVEPGTVAPFTEELTKGAILFLIFRYAASEFDEALDGIIYGAMVGLGFATAENASYFFRYDPALGIGQQMQTFQFTLRVVLLGLAGHATYTAITGLGFGLSRQTSRRWLQIALPILGLATAIFAHALWNSRALQVILNPAIAQLSAWDFLPRVALINGPFVIGVIIATTLSLRKEARVIATELGNELEANHPYLSPAMMLTAWGRFHARRRILWTHGVFAWWTLKQLQRAYIELAFCKWRGKNQSDIRRRIKVLRERLDF
ncbi:PrsW family intramembrane metalloprotease [candidate division KSB1 bacterium]|nr:PrsW family intramembrane metalloprotease [candidate division KSB1 bacterium]